MFSFQQSLSVLLLGLQQGHKWVNWMKRKKSLLHKQHVWGFFKVKRRAKNLKHFSSDRQKPLKRSTFFFCLIAIHTYIRLHSKSQFQIGHSNLTLYIVDVLWGQPIKLAQVASTSELHENQRNDILFFEIVPSHSCGASEVQT